MKKVIAIVLSLFFAVGVFAQKKGNDPQKQIERMNERMKTELNLTDAQFEKVKVINEDFVMTMKEKREAGDREAMMNAKEKYHNDLDEVLDDEQMAKFDEQVKQRRAERKQLHDEFK